MIDEVASKLYSTDAPEDMSATYLTKHMVIGYTYFVTSIQYKNNVGFNEMS